MAPRATRIERVRTGAEVGSRGLVATRMAAFRPIARDDLRRLLQWFWLIQVALLGVDIGLFRAWLGIRGAIRLTLILSPHVFSALGAFLAYRVLDRVGPVLNRLWDRGALSVRDDAQPKEPPPDTGHRYAEFARIFEARLNSSKEYGKKRSRAAARVGRLFFGLGFAGLWYWFFPSAGGFPWGFPLHLNRTGFWIRVAFGLDFGVQLLLVFFLGVMAWRLVVVALEISKLSREFDFTLPVRDPDKGGGLNPLGELCFSIASVWAAVAIYSTGWLIGALFQTHYHTGTRLLFDSALCVVPAGGRCYNFMALHFTFFFGVLLAINLVLALGTFFIPLYSVHRGMVRQRPRRERELDLVAARRNGLAQDLLDQVIASGSAQTDDRAKEIDALQTVYDDYASVPRWPFDSSVAAKFLGATVIPLSGITAWLPSLIGKLVGAPH